MQKSQMMPFLLRIGDIFGIAVASEACMFYRPGCRLRNFFVTVRRDVIDKRRLMLK